jgi:hypothetical protein
VAAGIVLAVSVASGPGQQAAEPASFVNCCDPAPNHAGMARCILHDYHHQADLIAVATFLILFRLL